MDNQLSVIYERFINGYSPEGLDIFSLMAILCGIAIIINKNPIVSIIFLIGLFASIAVYLILLGLTFIGLSYLIVYIGAVSILFLFILMLLNIRTSELQSNNTNSIALGFIILLLTNLSLFQLLPYSISILNSSNSKLNTILHSTPLNKSMDVINSMFNNINNDNLHIMLVTSNNWDGAIAETNHISVIGNILYTSHNMWLFMSSFILLLAMVGAIIITIKNEKAEN